MELYELFFLMMIVMVAGFIQSVTGFGFGIFAMIFLPYLLTYTEANTLSSMLSMLTSLLVILATFRNVSWKNLIFPLVSCTVTTYLSVIFIKSQKNDTLLLLLGIVLFLLSVYFFFFSGKIKIKPTWYAGLIAGMFSGFMGGMFSISGPPVVIYYMQSEKDSDHYLATISAYFVISGAISITTKATAGFITANVWLSLAVGVLGMALGSLIGKKARSKNIKPSVIKKSVYGVMAVSGIVNVLQVVL